MYRHWERLDAGEALGAMWIVDQELDGLTSAILGIGIDATAALVAEQLAELGPPIDVMAVADRQQRDAHREAA